VLLQHGVKIVVYAERLAKLTKSTGRRNILNVYINNRALRPKRTELDLARILQPASRAPTNLLIRYPILIDGIPFKLPNHLHYPVAPLLIVVSNFLDKAHKFRKVVK